jgi:hypothetical protein
MMKDDSAWDFIHSLESQEAVISFLKAGAVKLINAKRIRAASALLHTCAAVAANRARDHSSADPIAVSAGLLLHLSLPRLLFAKHRSPRDGSSKETSWKEVVERRVQRFLVGDWEALWNDAAGAAFKSVPREGLTREAVEALAGSSAPW